jgi:type VI secretion system secreted protein VgrG
MNDMAAYTAIAKLENPSPAVYLHCAVMLDGNRVLGAETFRLVALQGQEHVSDHFEFNLELHGNTDYRQERIGFDALMGRAVTFAVQLPIPGATADDPAWAEGRFRQALQDGTADGLSLFNGIAAGFAMEIPGVYRLTVRPAVWRLTLTNHYRIFSQQSVRETIAAVLDEHRVAYDMQRVAAQDNLASARIQDWFQAGESDYDFIRRLMGKAHLYYYYRHTGDGHVMVFDNRPNYPPVFADGRALRYTFTGADELGLAQADAISQYSYARSMVSSGVKSVFARQEETWEKRDSLPHYQTFEHALPRDPGELPFRLYRIYQYGCSKTEVKDYTDATAQTLAASGIQFSGASNSACLRAGHQFQVAGESPDEETSSPLQPSLDEQRFVLTQVEHQASLDGAYSNKFQATSAAELVNAFSLQETQQGTVLATVVANSGESAPSGWKFYRKDNFDLTKITLEDKLATPSKAMADGVLVVFSTDGPSGKPSWVKLASHMQTVPEIGAMVVVARSSDESELPEIQAIVHANGSKVVVPGEWTANTNVGNGYNTHYGDGQNISLGKETPQSVLDKAVGIVTDAYDSGNALGFSLGHFRDAAYSQGASYSYSTSEDGKDGTLSASESYGSTYGKQQGAKSWNRSEFDNTESHSTVNQLAKSVSTNNLVENTSTTTKQTSTSTTGTNVSTSTTGSNTSNDTTGETTTTQLVGKSTSTSATGMSTSTQVVGSSTSISATGSSSAISMEGSSSQTSLTGMRSSVTLLGQGSDVSLTGSTSSVSAVGSQSTVSAVGSVDSQSMTGSSTSMAMTGTSTGMNLTGAAVNTNITGASTDTSVTGVSVRTSVTGSSTEISVAGNTNSVSMVGLHSSISLSGPGVSISAAAPEMKIDLNGGEVEMTATIIIIM